MTACRVSFVFCVACGRRSTITLVPGPSPARRRAPHQTLAKVTSDIARRRTFNTAIAAVMELLNAVGHYQESGAAAKAVRQEALQIAVLALSPIVPHIC